MTVEEGQGGGNEAITINGGSYVFGSEDSAGLFCCLCGISSKMHS